MDDSSLLLTMGIQLRRFFNTLFINRVTSITIHWHDLLPKSATTANTGVVRLISISYIK